MKTTYYHNATIITQLLYRDFYIFRQSFLSKLEMSLYLILVPTFIAKFFLPSMGLHNFGPFILVGSIVSYGFFMCMNNAMSLIEDVMGSQAIEYELTLPIQQSLIFFKIALSTMLQSLIITLCLVPCGLFFITDSNPFPDLSITKLITILTCASIFYGSFSLILATFIKSMSQVDNVWLRIFFPIWYLGCFQFPWRTLYNISPEAAYANLLNPMTLIMEAGRSATINSAGSLPFGLCCVMILLYSTISCIIGIYWMRKRLDCI